MDENRLEKLALSVNVYVPAVCLSCGHHTTRRDELVARELDDTPHWVVRVLLAVAVMATLGVLFVILRSRSSTAREVRIGISRCGPCARRGEVEVLEVDYRGGTAVVLGAPEYGSALRRFDRQRRGG